MRTTALVLLSLGAWIGPARADGPTFEADVRPLLVRRCTACHSTRKLEKRDISGGLALDNFDAVRKGTAEHRIVEPGHPGASELFLRLTSEDEEKRMPQGDEPLPAAERDVIRRWIEAGAPRGEPVSEAPSAPITARKPARRLDVVLPLDAKAGDPKDKAKPAGPVEVVLKVGPLPAVSALAFRGDGRMLAVGTAGRVVLWDLAEATPAAFLEDLPGQVHALALSRDGRRLAVGSGVPARSGAVRVYAIPDGTLVADLAGHEDAVYAVAFSPDGRRLASAGFDGSVRIWDLVAGGSPAVFTGHSDFVYEAAFTPDGRSVLTAGKDRSVKRIDAASAAGQRTYSGHNDEVLALAVRPDGGGFVSAGVEPQLRWWTLDGEKPAKSQGGHSGPVLALAFAADGSKLISAGADRSVRLWDGRSGGALKQLQGATDWQYAAALSADGQLAAAGGGDGVVRLWDAGAGKLLRILVQPPGDGSTDWLAASPTGEIHASTGLQSLIRWRVGGADVPANPLIPTP